MRRAPRCANMAADPPDTDPADRDPRERGLERRSGDPSLLPWIVVGVVVLLFVAVYAIWAIRGP